MRGTLLLLLLLVFTSLARADGKLFQRAVVAQPPTTPDQRALVVFDAERCLETLVVETTVDPGGAASGGEFAWVIPLPAKPAIEASTTGLFPSIEMFCSPELAFTPIRPG